MNKVFWFFFSKKNIFFAFAPASGQHIPPGRLRGQQRGQQNSADHSTSARSNESSRLRPSGSARSRPARLSR